MIRIVTDSMADITQEEAAQWGVEVLPLVVRFGQEEYLDGIDLALDAFYARLQRVKELPKTSQLTPARFRDAFERNLANGDEVLCITGSSRLSGTYQSAVLARSMMDRPERVHLVDSMSASLGEAQLVLEALRQRDVIRDAAMLAAHVEAIRARSHLVGQAQELKYLVMGGRLNAAVGTIGATLHIKPMLCLSEGVIHQAGLCRSQAKVHQWYLERLAEYPPDPAFPLILAGAACDAQVMALKCALEDSGVTVASMRQIGTVIGTYTGPGLTTMSWIARAASCQDACSGQ